MKKTMIFNKINLEVAKLTSKTKGREIAGVLFTKDKTVATNSIALIEISTPKNLKIEDYPKGMYGEPVKEFEPFIADKSVMRKVVVPNIEEPLLPVLNSTVIKAIGDTKVEFMTSDLETTDILSVKKLPGDYPKYEEVFPKSQPVKIKVNAEQLVSLLEILGKLGGRNSEVTLNVHTKEDMLSLSAGENSNQVGRGLLAGIRMD